MRASRKVPSGINFIPSIAQICVITSLFRKQKNENRLPYSFFLAYLHDIRGPFRNLQNPMHVKYFHFPEDQGRNEAAPWAKAQGFGPER